MLTGALIGAGVGLLIAIVKVVSSRQANAKGKANQPHAGG